MTMPTLLIVDDEPLARARLRDVIQDMGGYAVVGEAANGLEAMHQLQQLNVSVMLVDIRMPEMDGIELAQHARKLAQPPHIIFTTAYDQFAVQAFELNAIDYLLKPIRRERLAVALSKVKPLQSAQWQALQPLQTSHTHLSIHQRGRVLLVAIADIIYARADLKYVTVRTQQQQYLWEGSLNQLALRHADHFVRIHRNALVARDAVLSIEKQPSHFPASSQAASQLAASQDTLSKPATWQVTLRGVPETLAISRRQFALLKSLLP